MTDQRRRWMRYVERLVRASKNRSPGLINHGPRSIPVDLPLGLLFMYTKTWVSKINPYAKSRWGKYGGTIPARFEIATLDILDAWAEKHDVSRSEPIRRCERSG